MNCIQILDLSNFGMCTQTGHEVTRTTAACLLDWDEMVFPDMTESTQHVMF